MARPPKPVAQLVAEGKSHRTKSELKQRKDAEDALLTGFALKVKPEVRQNEVAYKEFKRLLGIFKKIGKNDAIYEAVINRYCMIYAECIDFEQKRESFHEDLQELTEDKENLVYYETEDGEEKGEISLTTYYKMKSSMQKTIIDLDKQVQAKRKMLMEIEKENIMTIASALRSIPKAETKPASNPLLEALNSG